jgi:flagellar motor protein MotB
MMRFIKFFDVAAMATILLFGSGCSHNLREENQELRNLATRYEQENQRLMAQLAALRAKPEGVDPAELQRLEAEIRQRDQKLSVLRNALGTMQDQMALTGQIERKLQQLADELGGELVGSRLLLPGDYFFASGRYDLMPEGKAALKKFTDILGQDRFTLMISGYTDNVPIKHSRRYGVRSNRQLSLLRALSVLEQLHKNGYPENLMYPTGWGELHPVADNNTAHGRQLNRRVEIYIDPAGSDLLNAAVITDVSIGDTLRPAAVAQPAAPVVYSPLPATTYAAPISAPAVVGDGPVIYND